MMMSSPYHEQDQDDDEEEEDLHEFQLTTDTSLNTILNTPLTNFSNSQLQSLMNHQPLLQSPPPLQQQEPQKEIVGFPTEEVAVKTRKKCQFDGCTSISRRNNLCRKHGGFTICKMPQCSNPANRFQLCRAHGGYRKCTFAGGCDTAAKVHGLCKKHGQDHVPLCKIVGCQRKIRVKGLCYAHGGYRLCTFEGCQSKADHNKLCGLHGGYQLCKTPGCSRKVRAKGVCFSHGGYFTCSQDGCERVVNCKKLCAKHGGYQICRIEGCDKKKKMYGLCKEHGGVRQCQLPSCEYNSYKNGLCKAHFQLVSCKVHKCEKIVLSNGMCADHGGKNKCMDRDCEDDAFLKTEFCKKHGGFPLCKSVDCTELEFKNGLCISHGSFFACQFKTCHNIISSQGFCSEHRPIKRRKMTCNIKDCSKIPVQIKKSYLGFCKDHLPVQTTASLNDRHIGKHEVKETRKTEGAICIIGNCTYIVFSNNLCEVHLRNIKCHIPNCWELMLFKGYCRHHSSRCNYVSCNNIVRKGVEYCPDHEGTLMCKINSCDQMVYKKKLCADHCGFICKDSNCSRIVHRKGLCQLHTDAKKCKVSFYCGNTLENSNGEWLTLQKDPIPNLCIEVGCKSPMHYNRLCEKHIKPFMCSSPNCQKLIASDNVCVSHGGSFQCTHSGCYDSAMDDIQFCYKHGGFNFCSIDGCQRISFGKGLCVFHGEFFCCKNEYCCVIVSSRGFCASHQFGKKSTKVACLLSRCSSVVAENNDLFCENHHSIQHVCDTLCKITDCNLKVQCYDLCQVHLESIVCWKTNCSNLALSKGLCRGHGGSPRCNYLTCHQFAAFDFEFCLKHRGNILCLVDGCTKRSQESGYCLEHEYESKQFPPLEGSICMFKGCQSNINSKNEERLCSLHRANQYQICSKVGCQSNVYANERQCEKHLHLCAAKGCFRIVEVNGVCYYHQSMHSVCKVLGCVFFASFNTEGFCRLHFGKNADNDEVMSLNDMDLLNEIMHTRLEGMSKKCCYEDCCSVAMNNFEFCAIHAGYPTCKIKNCDQLEYQNGQCLLHGNFFACMEKDCQVVVSEKNNFCKGHEQRCAVSDCCNKAFLNNLCGAHVNEILCSHEGCEKLIISHDVCEDHGGVRRCSDINCNSSRCSSSKFCLKHGGKVLCRIDGCEKQPYKKGLCVSHGGFIKCKEDGCATPAHSKGLCRKHRRAQNLFNICKVSQCTVMSTQNTKGYCREHFKNQKDGHAVTV